MCVYLALENRKKYCET